MNARQKPRERKKFFDGIEIDTLGKLILESDRGCVLVAGAAIDEALGDLLKEFFKKTGAPQDQIEITKLIAFFFDEEPLPPLGSTGIKARFAYLLGLIGTADYGHIKRLIKFRNSFAHISEPVELIDDDIRRLTNLNAWPLRLREIHRDCTIKNAMGALPVSDAKHFSEARLHFMTIAMWVHMAIDINVCRLRENRPISLVDPETHCLPPP